MAQTGVMIHGMGDLDVLLMGGRRGGGGVAIGGIDQTSPPDPSQQQDGNMWYRLVDGKMFMFAHGAWFQVW